MIVEILGKLFRYKYTLLMITLIIASFIFIHPNIYREGAKVTSSINPHIKEGDIIYEINGIKIKNSADFYRTLEKLKNETSFQIKIKREVFPYIYKDITISYYSSKPGDIGVLGVKDIGATNIDFGIDLSGGIRVIVSPVEENVSADTLKNVIEGRLNFYGVADVRVYTLVRSNKVVVEVPSTSIDLLEILQHQGVFEAKIGNRTAFTGEEIQHICTSPAEGCVYYIKMVYKKGNRELWEGAFEVFLKDSAAKRLAEIIKGLEINKSSCFMEYTGQVVCYLNETIKFVLDNETVSELAISSDLKDAAIRTSRIDSAVIKITRGSREEVEYEMKKLIAILQSGSLPTRIKIESITVIPPLYGSMVLRNIILLWVLGIVTVFVVLFVRYRSINVASLIIMTALVETFCTLGLAAGLGNLGKAFRWTIDLPALAGIIAAVGTGIDDQIIITDEVLYGRRRKEGMETSIKKAFFVVIAGYLITVASISPLFVLAGGTFRGFAVSTIIGVTLGAFITRPAYAEILRRIYHKD